MDYDKDTAFNAVTSEGLTVSVTKYGYGQETAFIDEDGKTYLQNPTTLEIYPSDIDKDKVNERVVHESPGVITSSLKDEPKKAKAEAATSKK
jgi:hypothetical protein